MRRQLQSGNFSMVYEGKTYNASYHVHEGMITVQTARGQESTRLGGLRLTVLAKMLLEQLIRTGRAGWGRP
jgi:hypothetical protein